MDAPSFRVKYNIQFSDIVKPIHYKSGYYLKKKITLYLIEMPFNIFANRADPDQAA